jgi:hypothetical protein
MESVEKQFMSRQLSETMHTSNTKRLDALEQSVLEVTRNVGGMMNTLSRIEERLKVEAEGV